MEASHTLDAIAVSFDDERLVADAELANPGNRNLGAPWRGSSAVSAWRQISTPLTSYRPSFACVDTST